jgi:hypothetical protein
LVDAVAGEDLGPLPGVVELDVYTQSLTIRADVAGCTGAFDLLHSVHFDVNKFGVRDSEHCERHSPYAAFGNVSNDEAVYHEKYIQPGTYMFEATPFEELNCDGAKAGYNLYKRVTFVRECPGSVVSFKHYDAESSTWVASRDFMQLCPGDTTFEAVTENCNGDRIHSVRLELFDRTSSDSVAAQKVENIVPYTLFGDIPSGAVAVKTVNEGAYTLIATPYSRDQARGTAGNPSSVYFTVKNSAACDRRHLRSALK